MRNILMIIVSAVCFWGVITLINGCGDKNPTITIPLSERDADKTLIMQQKSELEALQVTIQLLSDSIGTTTLQLNNMRLERRYERDKLKGEITLLKQSARDMNNYILNMSDMELLEHIRLHRQKLIDSGEYLKYK